MRNILTTKTLLTSFILFAIFNIFSQACQYLGPDQLLPCGQTSTTITADFSQCSGGTTTAPKETNTYLVENIPFDPQPNLGTQVFLGDDQVSGALPIGFTFCFFGNTYTNFYIGSNGWISFSPGQPTTFTSASIPSAAANVPKNCVMGPWQDWHPGVGGQIRYQTQGTAPCRRLVVTFNVVPFFSCTSTNGTFQFVLYEGTNVIENHITNKGSCSWAGGTATQGIHNLAGNTAFTVPGRNNSVWTTTNNAWRYTPNGAPVTPTLTWYEVGNPTPIATGVNTITVTPPANGASYTAVQQYSGCYAGYNECVGASGGIPQDTVFVMPNANTPSQFDFPTAYCQGQTIPALPNTSINNITGTWTPAINAQQTTAYTFNPNPGQCSDPVQITISVTPNTLPTFDSYGPYCNGDVIPELPLNSINGISGTWSPAIDNQQTTTYSFSPAQGFCAFPTQATISVLPTTSSTTNTTVCSVQLPYFWNGVNYTSEGQYQATLIGQNGCDSIATLNLTVVPTLNSYTSVTICQNQIPYFWNGSTYTLSGVYGTNLVSSIGCDSIATLNLTVAPMPHVAFTASVVAGCAPLMVNFTNTSNSTGSCVWNLGNGSIINSCDDVAGIYTNETCYDVSLQITSDQGCTITTTAEDMVCVDPAPIASFSVNPQIMTTLNPSAAFTNTSQGSVSQTWNFGDGSGTTGVLNPNHTYPGEMGNYLVTLVVSNSNGCLDSITQSVLVDNQVIYYIPNSFTPSGDSFNETFKPIFTDGFDVYQYNFVVFNRWGEILFESNNADFGWDGTYGGKLCPLGTYIWQIRYKETGKDRHDEMRGHFHLLR